MKFICNKIAGISSTIAFAILCLAQPANALIFNWQFTNDDPNFANFGNPTDVVAGFVEFNDADVFPNATNVTATNLQITSITGLSSTSTPFFGDGGIELNENLSGGVSNSFSFDSSSQIAASSFSFDALDALDFSERLDLSIENGEGFSFIEDGRDLTLMGTNEFSSSLTFTQQASGSVPFEFSPTLGLLLVGGVFASSRYIKYRKTFIK